MQPAPIEDPNNATSVDQPQRPSRSTQYGLLHQDRQASDSLQDADAVREPQIASSDDGALVESSGTPRGRPHDAGRLSHSPNSPQETSPGNRIFEYEQAHSTPRRASEEVLFQVIPSSKGAVSRIPFEHFPNEVLTHILSHLAPETISAMSSVSRRFHKLVTTSHPWRIAFTRYFPGADSVGLSISFQAAPDAQKSERRTFTRLSALASWRSEYILRTRLLRSLSRGRPAVATLSKSNSSRNASNSAAAVVTYSSGLLYPTSHIHATFGYGLNKKQPLFMHGAVEQGAVSTSDPGAGKISSWGLGDFEAFKHFADLYTGEAEYGLGSGDVVGMSNVMDLSQPYGKLYGEACPGGRPYYTSTSEQRGRWLPISSEAKHELGIPEVSMLNCSVTAVWIAKSEGVLKMTNGIFGCLVGFSNGVLSAHALGVNPVHDRRYEKGEPTARWALCPGVPIIAVSVDEKVSTKRIAAGRVWATVLNALGEVYFLTDVPARPEFKGRPTASDTDRLAWQTGRSLEWTLIENSRRSARPDPYNMASVDGSYTPRTSSLVHGLGKAQLIAESLEVEKFLKKKPKDFQKSCDGWDMQRKLVVDYGGDDKHGAGEAVFVLTCALQEGSVAGIRRFARQRKKFSTSFDLDPFPAMEPPTHRQSIFGSGTPQYGPSASPASTPRSRTSSHDETIDANYKFAWHISTLGFGDLRGIQIAVAATDDSDLATLTAQEDPLLGMSGGSNASTPIGSPLSTLRASSLHEIPGGRARFMAVGTRTGVVILWDMRAEVHSSSDVVNTVSPSRIIFTRSPQISSLALTSLHIVHGGNDGLVQAWDPLASTTEPIRTLNSRFSDRARRRIAQAEASVQGVGNNYFAAGAIALDPDPTVLRGMVSLGTHLRYWSYSSSSADAYKGRKRGQLRRRSDQRHNPAASEKITATGRTVIRDLITSERDEMERDRLAKEKQQELLRGRFGTDLLGAGASEEELLAYATMLSEEALNNDEARRFEQPTSDASQSARIPQQDPSQYDADVEEAIRLSLLESKQSPPTPTEPGLNIPIRYAKSSRHGTPKPAKGSAARSPSSVEQHDLEFALQLSLAEQESKILDGEEFPELPVSPRLTGQESAGRGKGKSRGRQ